MGKKNIVERLNIEEPSLGKNPTKLVFTQHFFGVVGGLYISLSK
jgi:hypothetical protein